MEKLFLTVREAAELLRYRPSTLYSKISDGTFPSVKVGGKRLIDIDEVERMIEDGEEEDC
jgi:excisionase family DNA binding protein